MDFFDRDPISRWTFGSDYKDKDGIYISRTFEEIEIFDDFQLSFTPYYLIQRSLNNYTNAFRSPNSSILSSTTKNDVKFSDSFALDANLKGELFGWNFGMKNSFNTLNVSRLSEALRSKTTLRKSFDLNSKKSLIMK